MKVEAQLEDAICLAALELRDPVQRKAFLDRACAGDERLRAKVDEKLALENDAEEFFVRSRSAVASAKLDWPSSDGASSDVVPADEVSEPADPQIGLCVGRYKLLQRLGEGGCGTVYMAEQEEPVRRRVALKIIKSGMDSKSVIARFEAERQALAMMDHPNIARVLDAGETEFGRPYFVMELVRGTRITKFCDENNFSTRQRLELFIQVCRAIQHAHQKGIIHRDVKPSNILVTLHDGTPLSKVIDFGIAKATEGRLTDNTMCTACEQFLGTPAYMSPEQAEMSGLDVDTRSDIYSLGVLLYELLTGRTPFDSKALLESGFDAMRKTLREKEPLAPSTMITSLKRAELDAAAAHRFVDPTNLVSQLKGDLDWIVLKALEKDRSRRYETVNGLAMDVQRYLNNEPVYARPPSRLYRLQKLVRRNRAVFISAAAVSLALTAGFSTSTWLFFKERQAKFEAQRGREAEALLRRKAEAREIIAQAMSLIESKQFEKADQLVGNIPSSDAADVGMEVFRPLGDWAVQSGNWKRAAEYYSVVVRLTQFERTPVSSRDYNRYAVVVAELGEHEAYENFCRELIKRYGEVTDPVIAERILKNSLLLPPSSELLASLAPLAQRVERSIPSNVLPAPRNDTVPWKCMALALMSYRGGHYAEAAHWSSLGLKFPGDANLPRVACTHAILAMADHQLGRDDEARDELAQSTEETEKRFNLPFNYIDEHFDWLLARLLEREATALVGSAD